MKRKILVISALIAALTVAAAGIYLKPKYVVPILMYHSINQGGDKSSLCVSEKNFAGQMRFLRKHKYNVISLNEFVQGKINHDIFARNTVVITFDDGYEDNFSAAYPILKKYNLPATMFVVVNAIDHEGYLSLEQIEQMRQAGLITIGSHSLEGDYLPGKDSGQIAEEIGISKLVLEISLEDDVDFFCYPIGGFTPEIEELVRDYGYLAACTTNRGKTQTYLNDDLFALKRIKVKDSAFNSFVFWVKLSGYYNFFRTIKAPHQ